MLLSGFLVLACFGMTFTLLASAVRRVRVWFMDTPNARSLHTIPTPRLGGAAVVSSLGVTLSAAWGIVGIVPGYWLIHWLLPSLVVALVGLLDDLHETSIGARLLSHFFAASVVVFHWLGPSSFTGFGWPWISLALSILALVWATNLFNFMDGIDGFAASEALFITVAWCGYSILQQDTAMTTILLIFAAALLAFLSLNWQPAKIFLGDAGSGFLGFSLATFALIGAHYGIPLSTSFILAGYFVSDASYTLLRRMWQGEACYQAHRSHVYQVLANKGLPHQALCYLLFSINALWLLPLSFFAYQWSQVAWLMVAIAYTPLLLAVHGLAQNDCFAHAD